MQHQFAHSRHTLRDVPDVPGWVVNKYHHLGFVHLTTRTPTLGPWIPPPKSAHPLCMAGSATRFTLGTGSMAANTSVRKVLCRHTERDLGGVCTENGATPSSTQVHPPSAHSCHLPSDPHPYSYHFILFPLPHPFPSLSSSPTSFFNSLPLFLPSLSFASTETESADFTTKHQSRTFCLVRRPQDSGLFREPSHSRTSFIAAQLLRLPIPTVLYICGL